MRRIAPLLCLTLLVAGCLEGPAGPPATDGLPSIVSEPSTWSNWTAVSHANGSAILKLRFTAPTATACSILFATHTRNEVSSAQAMAYDFRSDNESIVGMSMWVSTPYHTRARAAGVDTEPTTTAGVNVVYSALKAAGFGGGETFTRWAYGRNIALEAGAYNLTVASQAALDGGKEETHGGSMSIVGACDTAVRVESILEDTNALFLNYHEQNGSTDVNLFPSFVDVHEGSKGHVASAATAVRVLQLGACQGDLQISGPINESVEFEVRPPVSERLMDERFSGPAGAYTLAWDIACVGADGFAGFYAEVISLRPAASGALQATAEFPVIPTGL